MMNINFRFLACWCVIVLFVACDGRDNNQTHDNHEHHGHVGVHHEHNQEIHDHDSHSHKTYGHDVHVHEVHDHEVHRQDVHAHGVGIGFTKQQAQAAGLEVETVKKAQFRGVIKAAGHIQSPKGGESVVVATSAGVLYYTDPSIAEGMAVVADKLLASISSKKLQDGDPLLKAKLAYETALTEYQRALRLVDEKIVSAKDFEQIRLRYETAKTTYEGQAQGMSDRGASLRSPFSGYLKKILVPNGAYVEVGQPIAIVTQTKRLQLRAEVSERDYTQITRINGANFRPGYTDRIYKISDLNGRLVAYGKVAPDEASHYIPITFEFDNVGDIIAGAYAEVFLLTSSEEDVISIPVGALTEEQGLYYVYIQLSEEEYEKRSVALGRRDGERVEILHGLYDGERVVTHGAYQVKLASVTTAIPHGHSH